MARISVHVTPGARRDGIVGWQGDTLRVKVRARPEKGRANEAVLRLLSDRLGQPRADLRIVHGASSRDKLVEVDGLTQNELRTILGPDRPSGGRS